MDTVIIHLSLTVYGSITALHTWFVCFIFFALCKTNPGFAPSFGSGKSMGAAAKSSSLCICLQGACLLGGFCPTTPFGGSVCYSIIPHMVVAHIYRSYYPFVNTNIRRKVQTSPMDEPLHRIEGSIYIRTPHCLFQSQKT